DFKAFNSLVSLVKENRIELIHAHLSSVYWAIGLKFFVPKVKLIYHDHDGLSENLKDGDRPFVKLFSGKIDAVIAVNSKLRDWSLKNLKLNSNRCLLINNFVPPLTNPDFRPEKGEKIRIVCLANLRMQKDQHTLIR